MSYTSENAVLSPQPVSPVKVDPQPLDPGAALTGLFNRCAVHDIAALHSLYQDTAPALFAVLLRMLNSRELAEQVLRDTYLSMWEGDGSYRSEFGHALTWLLNLARSKAQETLRTQRVSSPEPQQQRAQSQAETLQQLDLSVGTNTVPRLLQNLDELESQVKTCVVDSYCHGYSYSNLATRLAKPVVTVKGWIRTGLVSLREEAGGSSDDQWWNLIAGEYVLGTLDDKEHKLYESILQHDREFLKRVVWWQEKMAPLDLVLPEVAPGSHIWPEITEQLHRDAATSYPALSRSTAGTVRLPAMSSGLRLRRWRAFATLAAVGCVLLSLLLWDQFKTRPANTMASYNTISLVQDDNSATLWVVDASTESQTLRMTALAPPDPGSGKAYELWLHNPQSKQFKSAGLLPLLAGQSVVGSMPGLEMSDSAFVVSLENSGGSGADGPSGEAVFQGVVQVLQN